MGKIEVILIGLLSVVFILLLSVYKENAKLKENYKAAITVIETQEKYAKTLNETLAKRDATIEASSKKLLQFQGQLKTLRENNADIKEVLSIVIPDAPLVGLRSYDSISTPARSPTIPVPAK